VSSYRQYPGWVRYDTTTQCPYTSLSQAAGHYRSEWDDCSLLRLFDHSVLDTLAFEEHPTLRQNTVGWMFHGEILPFPIHLEEQESIFTSFRNLLYLA
jgi:hypothetical protein